MKNIYVVGVAVALGACSAHPVRCRGALQPINEPAAASRTPAARGPAATNNPAGPPNPAPPPNPAEPPSKPAAAPREPQP